MTTTIRRFTLFSRFRSFLAKFAFLHLFDILVQLTNNANDLDCIGGLSNKIENTMLHTNNKQQRVLIAHHIQHGQQKKKIVDVVEGKYLEFGLYEEPSVK